MVLEEDNAADYQSCFDENHCGGRLVMIKLLLVKCVVCVILEM